MNNLLFFKILFIFILFSFSVSGQSLSYLYIQGDKITPFYVKVNGQMVTRYGKNYCIVPQLKPGNINVEILFQQNLYPPKQYTISVPENGYRGFLLDKKDNGYVLYDIESKTYLEK